MKPKIKWTKWQLHLTVYEHFRICFFHLYFGMHSHSQRQKHFSIKFFCSLCECRKSNRFIPIRLFPLFSFVLLCLSFSVRLNFIAFKELDCVIFIGRWSLPRKQFPRYFWKTFPLCYKFRVACNTGGENLGENISQSNILNILTSIDCIMNTTKHTKTRECSPIWCSLCPCIGRSVFIAVIYLHLFKYTFRLIAAHCSFQFIVSIGRGIALCRALAATYRTRACQFGGANKSSARSIR